MPVKVPMKVNIPMNRLVHLLSVTMCLFMLTVLGGWLATPVVAQTQSQSSSSASNSTSTSPTPTPDLTQTTQRLKERIEKIVDEKRDQIEGALDELGHKRKGFIGEIQRVSAETITLKTNKGTQIIPLSDQVSITKAGKDLAVDGIVVGDWAIIIGLNQDDQFQPERMLVSSATLRPKPQFVAVGTISAISRNSLKLQPRSGDNPVDINLVRQTQYQDAEGNSLVIGDLEKELQVLVVGVTEDEETEAIIIRTLGPVSDSDN